MKNRFSIELKNLLNQKGLSIYGLSEEIGIERTRVQKFISGSRHMSLDVFRQIIKILDPAPDKCLELHQLYEWESAGELVFREHQKFIEIFKDFNHFQKEKSYFLKSSKMMFDYEIGDLPLSFVEGNAQILATIENLFIKEMKKEKDAHVIISLRWDYAMLEQLILRMDHADIEGGLVQNIIPIVNKKNIDNNLDALKSAFHLACLKNINYEPRFYYTASKKDDISVIFPSYIITSTNLMFIDHDLKSAVIIDRPEVIALYRKKALDILAQAKPLFKKTIMEEVVSNLPSFIYEGKDERIEYISAQAAIDFLKRVDPIQKDEREALIRKFLNENSQAASVFLLRDQSFASENQVQFRYTEKNRAFEILFVCLSSQKLLALKVQELGMAKSFQDFIKYLPDSSYVYSQEEIQKWFKKTP
ncbi:MAG: helix-turn-helix domain-containing protein [Eubacteriaceae bacterium]